jgi:drug/metabolite transporter (DMT)-like permease
VLSSVCYARANLFTQEHFAGTPPLVIATVAITSGAFIILPFGLAQLPDRTPSLEALGAVVALGVLGTSLAYIVHFTLIRGWGAARTSLVTYLIPAFALFYGAVFLDEPITLGAVLGLALILAGVGLGSGLLRPTRRPAAGAAS